jgi:bHLH factor
MGGTNQPGNQNNNAGNQTNKRKRLNDGQQQQQQQQQQYTTQQSLFSSDPNLQSRYAGLAGSGYRATPGVNSALQPTLGDAVPQPVNTTTPPIGDGEDSPGNRPQVGSEEWHRQRRDNHKEVERRRRENINDGITELAKIVPGCEKNKGSILSRAVQYIIQLKDNESHNIEKWTLEKLLTDQAMAELTQTNEKLKVELERAWREAEAWKKTAAREDNKRS